MEQAEDDEYESGWEVVQRYRIWAMNSGIS